ncbi:unnamed protein product [Clonostachys solani]|uniref:DUF7600 domain-containing protein n=1 Tax=Clonostachys solani TaxID=160281 RepID=A0A9N9Z0U1_9HYPO|nr:unnamed protein product [Clonostachys solani]
MSPDSVLSRLLFQHPCCAICNSSFQTNNINNTWQKQYRVLFCDDAYSTSFSGLGIREAPLGGRWYVPKEYDETKTYSTSISHPRHESISVEGDKVEDISSRCGYIAHETCWRVLERIYAPRQVPWECLWRTLASLQGLSMQRLQSYDRVALGRAATTHFSEELEVLMNQEPQIPPARVTEVTPPEGSLDGFTCLPVELRLLIVGLLDMSDALKLRQSSKAFAFIFYSQTFWGQRFVSGHERAWVFGFSDQRPLSLPDWRSLYKLTGQHCTPGLQRMKYLWPFLRNLQDVVPDEPISSFAEDAVCDFEWNWLYLPRFIRHSWQVSYRQKVHLPTPMVAMRIHFVKFCSQSVVAGITFRTTCGSTRKIGYSTSCSKTLQFEEDPMGLDFKVTGDGIIDIQAAYPDNAEPLPGWLADVHHVPQDRLSLVICGRIGGVEGIFDGFRLLELKLSGIDD